MKLQPLLPFLLLVLLSGSRCSSSSRKISEGIIVYAVDYPDYKDNLFLYSILPKEMTIHFKNGKMESCIEKANLKNTMWIDCNKKSAAAYFRYGKEAYHVELTQREIAGMIHQQPEYSIRFLDDIDTMAGFKVKKAIATALKNPSDKIELWYTEEIAIANSNWHTPFKKIPGFLLAYSIDRYGIRMKVRAIRFENKKITSEQLKPEADGAVITYGNYNKKMNALFQSFE